MQTIVVILVVVAAVGYALWLICACFKRGGEACRGCKLANECKKSRKRDCNLHSNDARSGL